MLSDIKGAFDRCWWLRLKKRLKAKGMRKRALRLMRSYLFKRFLRVVASGKSSSIKEIFSSVPQGGKFSPPLWDFDISEMADLLGDVVQFFGYADDVALWYEVDTSNRQEMTKIINDDMSALKVWGDDNRTTFELDKTFCMVFSQKKKPFDVSGLVFEGFPIKLVKQTKAVGYQLDSRLRWGPMVDSISKKAKGRLAGLSRVRRFLDSTNMKAIYEMFIRSIMEYGSVAWMGAADSHLHKLDRVQRRAESIGNFTTDTLAARREVAALSFALKLMDGQARGVLKNHIPQLYEPLLLSKKRTRQVIAGKQVKSRINTKSLDVYRRGFHGALPSIWRKLPQELVTKGYNRGWLKIKTACKNFLLGKVEKPKTSVKKSKPAHQGVKGIDQVACATFLQELSSDLTFMM